MFTHNHYVPVLKAKEGEFKALLETFAPTKDLMTPLLEVVNVTWDYEDNAEANTIEVHLSKIGKKILDNWGDTKRVFVDSNLIEPDKLMSDAVTHHLVYLFNDFRVKNLQAIPTSGLERHLDYKNSVRAIATQDGMGICLRLQNADLAKSNLKNLIDVDLTLYGLSADSVDLIIDLESIVGANSDLLVLTMQSFINTRLPYLNNWRSLTLVGSSFPTDLRDVAGNSIDTIDRDEWTIWNSLLASGLTRKPAFGDYGIAHPDILDIDPRNMTISASIRYTCDSYWLIIRGRSLKKYKHIQYRNLSANLIAHAEYCGAAYSWGDNYINDCATAVVGTGNPGTWRKVGNNHHFQKVTTQVSIVP